MAVISNITRNQVDTCKCDYVHTFNEAEVVKVYHKCKLHSGISDVDLARAVILHNHKAEFRQADYIKAKKARQLSKDKT